ncbi:MAG: hypothetical protein ACK4VI_01190 [Alphaproteobacteria bacterium]
MSLYRLFHIKAAFAARAVQADARRQFERLLKEFPDNQDLIAKSRSAIRYSEELVIDADSTAYTPEQLANFDY